MTATWSVNSIKHKRLQDRSSQLVCTHRSFSRRSSITMETPGGSKSCFGVSSPANDAQSTSTQSVNGPVSATCCHAGKVIALDGAAPDTPVCTCARPLSVLSQSVYPHFGPSLCGCGCPLCAWWFQKYFLKAAYWMQHSFYEPADFALKKRNYSWLFVFTLFKIHGNA